MATDVAPHLMTLLDQVQSHFMNSLSGGVAHLPDKPEGWAFVGMPTETAVAQLSRARALFAQTRAPKFLDCGSGLGFVTALANRMGFQATGLEWSEAYITLAKSLFPTTRLIQGDVLAFTGYADFDVIYYYGPFADDAFQLRFEEKVEAEAKVGAVIIANRKISNAWRDTNHFELLAQDGFMGVFLRKTG